MAGRRRSPDDVIYAKVLHLLALQHSHLVTQDLWPQTEGWPLSRLVVLRRALASGV